MIWSALKSRLLSLLPRRAVAVPIIATPDLLPFTPTRPVRVVEVNIWEQPVVISVDVMADEVNWRYWNGKEWLSQSAGLAQ